MKTSIAAVLSLSCVAAAHHPYGYPNHVAGSSTFGLKKFTSLVAFGDSYTDDSRLGYFISHNGSAPPVGYDNPAVSSIAGAAVTQLLT